MNERNSLRAALAASGLDRAGHKRAAELHLVTDAGDLTTALIHATLAGGADGDAARLEADLAAALEALKAADAERTAMADELERARAAQQRAERNAQALRDQVYREAERAEAAAARAAQAALDRNRYRAQSNAVKELCQTLREEGHIGIARRIEDALHDADITVAKQLAAATNTPPDGENT
ncbi:hypothetical protein [Actinomadura geliboluensis]|uniref:hypothetical protein n=1 Tax=Actinomadura geliboluensis TaxID=882440 RepID=UPI00367EC31D